MAGREVAGLTKARIEALTDGLFATVMTILVLTLVVPTVSGPNASAMLTAALQSLLPNIYVYIATFIFLGVVWVGHHNMFSHINYVDRTLLWLNLLLLLSVGFVPFTTSLLGRYPLQHIAILVYGINGLAISLIFAIVRWHSLNNCLTHKETTEYINKTIRVNIVGPILYGIALISSFAFIWISLAMFAFVPIFFIAAGKVYVH